MSSLQELKRKVHHRRFTEVLATYVLGKADQKLKASTLYKQLDISLKNAGDQFRKLIDDNAPLFYVLDLLEVANIIKEELQSDVQKVEKELRNYKTQFEFGGKAPLMFSSVTPKGSEQAVYSSDPEFYDVFSKSVLDNTFVTTLAKEMLAEIEAQIPIKKSIIDTYNAKDGLKVIFNQYVEELAQQASVVTKATYFKFGRISIKYAKRFKTLIFGNTRLFIASDKEKLLASKYSQYTVVIVSDTFTYGKEKINKALQDAADRVFASRKAISKAYDSKNPTASFKIGNFIDIGHTAAFAAGGVPIGVNMPAAQEVYVRLPTEAANNLEANLTGIYAELDLAIVLNQQYSELAENLLGIGTAFGVVMRKRINSTLLRTVENRIIATYKQQLEKNVSDVLNSSEVRLALEELAPLNITRSPTLPEYIGDMLEAVIDINRKTIPRIKKISKEENKKTSSELVAIKSNKGNLLSKTKRSSNIGPKKISIKPARIIPKNTNSTSLSFLLNLINKNLHDQIKRNMGTGTRTDVLNYRSGRFAKSAKVKRLSESRQGMITAFYSYMKNPYATFSAGGRQEFPRTRDPKLLISKSIRELAAEQVQNRLRAVLV